MDNFDRDDFQETIQDLSGLLAEPNAHEQIVWKVEYLRHSAWYHFYGMVRKGQSCGVGHVYDRRDRRTDNVSFNKCISIALGFHANACILTYGGRRSVSTDILEEIETRGATEAEIIRLGVEARSREASGRKVMSVTDVAFIGLRHSGQAHCLHGLATKDPSIKWCRNRRFVSALPDMFYPGDNWLKAGS